MKILGITLIELIANVTRPLLASIAMFAPLYFLSGTAVMTTPSLHGLIIAILTGAISYCVVLLMLWALTGFPKGSEQQILDIARNRINR
jgi:hypothetical protein